MKAGIGGARQALQAGCNDLGGTLMDENISRAAGASHGQELDDDELRAIVEPLGRPLVQRTTLYGRANTVGSRLRPPPEQIEADRSPRPPPRSREHRGAHRVRDRRRRRAVSREHRGIATPRRRRDRQRARRRASPRGRRLRRRARSRPGLDDAHRHRAGRDAVRGDGTRRRDLGRFGRQHDGRGRLVRRARAAFVGRVSDDQLGAVFGHDIRAAGVDFTTAPARRRPTAPPPDAASSWSRPTRSAP